MYIGQAGVQTGFSMWELFCAEHHIAYDGELVDDKLEYESLETLFHQASENKWVPRSLFVDLEPTVIDEIRHGVFRSLFHPDRLISGPEDAANNFSRGFFTVGKLLLGKINEQSRHLFEQCDTVQGILILRSLGGGTGAGLTSAMFEGLSDYSKTPKIEVPIYPSPTLSTSMVEPYNCLLGEHFCMEDIDVGLLLDNEAMFEISSKFLSLNYPTYSTINRMIAQIVSSVTASVRFVNILNCDLTVLQTNLVPYPRIHFPLCNFAPLMSEERANHQDLSVQDLTRLVFDRSNQMMKVDHFYGKFMSCALFFRGNVCPHHVYMALSEIKRDHSIEFVDWCPTGFKVGINAVSPVIIPDSKFAKTSENVAMLTNTSAIGQAWQRLTHRFYLLYSKRSFVHWFIGEGMEECEFTESLYNISALVKDYEEAGENTTVIENEVEKKFSEEVFQPNVESKNIDTREDDNDQSNLPATDISGSNVAWHDASFSDYVNSNVPNVTSRLRTDLDGNLSSNPSVELNSSPMRNLVSINNDDNLIHFHQVNNVTNSVSNSQSLNEIHKLKAVDLNSNSSIFEHHFKNVRDNNKMLSNNLKLKNYFTQSFNCSDTNSTTFTSTTQSSLKSTSKQDRLLEFKEKIDESNQTNSITLTKLSKTSPDTVHKCENSKSLTIPYLGISSESMYNILEVNSTTSLEGTLKDSTSNNYQLLQMNSVEEPQIFSTQPLNFSLHKHHDFHESQKLYQNLTCRFKSNEEPLHESLPLHQNLNVTDTVSEQSLLYSSLTNFELTPNSEFKLLTFSPIKIEGKPIESTFYELSSSSFKDSSAEKDCKAHKTIFSLNLKAQQDPKHSQMDCKNYSCYDSSLLKKESVSASETIHGNDYCGSKVLQNSSSSFGEYCDNSVKECEHSPFHSLIQDCQSVHDVKRSNFEILINQPNSLVKYLQDNQNCQSNLIDFPLLQKKDLPPLDDANSLRSKYLPMKHVLTYYPQIYKSNSTPIDFQSKVFAKSSGLEISQDSNHSLSKSSKRTKPSISTTFPILKDHQANYQSSKFNVCSEPSLKFLNIKSYPNNIPRFNSFHRGKRYTKHSSVNDLDRFNVSPRSEECLKSPNNTNVSLKNNRKSRSKHSFIGTEKPLEIPEMNSQNSNDSKRDFLSKIITKDSKSVFLNQHVQPSMNSRSHYLKDYSSKDPDTIKEFKQEKQLEIGRKYESTRSDNSFVSTQSNSNGESVHTKIPVDPQISIATTRKSHGIPQLNFMRTK